ncbi:MAG: hypothetical protein HFF19_01015 [Oscillospiraceae bacterium]|jgi:hypothetical protein|nr:hypothetical protein [Oscillospiraceae bacterium]
MEGNVILLNSARPERWCIDVRKKNTPSVTCFYQERGQCWVGMVDVSSMEELPEVLKTARNAMNTARVLNQRVEVAV